MHCQVIVRWADGGSERDHFISCLAKLGIENQELRELVKLYQERTRRLESKLDRISDE
jgi:hypothetical protein